MTARSGIHVARCLEFARTRGQPRVDDHIVTASRLTTRHALARTPAHRLMPRPANLESPSSRGQVFIEGGYMVGASIYGPQAFGNPFATQQLYGQPLQQLLQILQVIPQQLQQLQQLQYIQSQQLQQLQQLVQLVPQQIQQLHQPFGQLHASAGFPVNSPWGLSPQVFGAQPAQLM